MRLMNEREAAAMLGVSLSWLKKNPQPRPSLAVPFVKLGCLVRDDRNALEAWVKTQITTAPVSAADPEPAIDPNAPQRRGQGRPRKAVVAARCEAARAAIKGAQTTLIRSGELTDLNGVILNSFSPRQIAMNGWAGLATQEAVRRAADVLWNFGCLRHEVLLRPGASSSRTSNCYIINRAACYTIDPAELSSEATVPAATDTSQTRKSTSTVPVAPALGTSKVPRTTEPCWTPDLFD